MWSETRRPEYLDGVAGHAEIKTRLCEYLRSRPHTNVILLHGPPGIGKTTIAMASIRTCEMEPLEINASQAMRSFDDVQRLAQSCRHTRSITALMRNDPKPLCLLLDEVDGSDPHAQKKLMEWMTGDDRRVPVLLTCNEVPRIFKNKETIEILRCYPPKPADLVPLFPDQDVPKLAKRFKHDVRRIMQFLQYGESDVLPSASVPADCSPEVLSILKQKMWIERDPMVDSASESAHTSVRSPD